MSWEGLNRRKFPRSNFPCLIKIALLGQESNAILTHTENVSNGGICVIMKNSLELFTRLSIEVDLLDGEDLIKCQGKVVWSVRRKATEDKKPSCYDIGMEFLDVKDPDRRRIDRAIEHLAHSHQQGRM